MASVPPVEAPSPPPHRTRPRLVYFFSPQSGRCRRVEGHLAAVLQRRRNHEAFELVRVSVEERPDLAEHFLVDVVPTLFVIEGRKIRRRIVAPRGARDLTEELEPWLS